MIGKIALEEHFIHPDFVEYLGKTAPNISPELFGKAVHKLQDFGEQRFSAMDSIGFEVHSITRWSRCSGGTHYDKSC